MKGDLRNIETESEDESSEEEEVVEQKTQAKK